MLADNFVMFRTAQTDIPKLLDMTMVPGCAITDPYLNVLYGPVLGADLKGYESIIASVLESYKDREPDWKKGVDKTVASYGSKDEIPSSSLIVCAFLEEGGKNSGKAVKTLSNKVLTGFRNKLVFVKEPFVKGSELCRRWKAGKEGTIVVIRPATAEKKTKILKTYRSAPSHAQFAGVIHNLLAALAAEIQELKEKKAKKG